MIPEWQADTITQSPAITGRWGRAWAVDLDAVYARIGYDRMYGADIAAWLIEAPWAHTRWHSYWLNLVHLRPIPDAPPIKFYLDGATHELILWALNPEQPRQPQLDGHGIRRLTPKNFAAQLIEHDDAAAIVRVEPAVRMICDAELSPDTDFWFQWVALFGDNMVTS